MRSWFSGLVERIRSSIVLRRFNRAWKRLGEANEEVSEDELMEDIEEARRAVSAREDSR